MDALLEITKTTDNTDTMFSRQLTFAARVDVGRQELLTFKIFPHFFMFVLCKWFTEDKGEYYY